MGKIVKCVKTGWGKAKVIGGTVVTSGLVAVGSAMAEENALTTAAKTQMAGVQTDVVSLGTVMVGIAATMAIAGVIFVMIKKR